ncbi:MAG TPA: nickel insertion protein [Chthoniobacterales bacterium]
MRILLVHGHAPVTATQLVGALADLGVSPSTFEWELSKVDLGDCHLHFDQADARGQGGVAFSVHGGATHAEGGHGDEPHESDHTVKTDSYAADEHQGHGHAEAVGGGGRTATDAYPRVNLGSLRQRVSDSELSTPVKELTLKLLGHVPGGLPAVGGRTKGLLSQDELALLAPAVLLAIGIDQLQVAAVQMRGEYGGSREVAAASPHADRPFEMDSLVRALHDALPASSALDGVEPSRRGTGLEADSPPGSMSRVEVALLEI